MNHKISVIIPVWNREDKIINCLKSIEKQTFKDIEVIIIDDGSTDNTVSIIKDYINNNSLLDIQLFQIGHSGVSIARNDGIDKCSGEYIFFLDSDDSIFKNTFLETVYKTIIDKNCDIVFTKFYFYYRNYQKKVLGSPNTLYNGIDLIKNCRIINCYYNPSLYFLKKSFIIDNNIRFIENLYMEDRLFLFDLALNNAKFYILDEISILRTLSKNSITACNLYDYQNIIIFSIILEKVKKYFGDKLYRIYYKKILLHLNGIFSKINKNNDKEIFLNHFNNFKRQYSEIYIADTSN